jgi:hypothetical protein
MLLMLWIIGAFMLLFMITISVSTFSYAQIPSLDIYAVRINIDDAEVADPYPEEETPNLLTLNVFFRIDNPTNKTLTISRTDYTIFANGQFLGDGYVDYVDIPVNGRPQVLPGHMSTISSKFEIPRNDPTLAYINIGNLSSSDINWEAEGTADIEYHQQIPF